MVIKTKYGNACFVKAHGKGYYIISSSKEGNRGKQLHRLIYEDHYGPIPKGMQIHHIDGDTTNNSISNLQMVSISEHNKIHKVGNTYTLGYKHTHETKQDLSIKAKERWSNPEYRDKVIESKTKKFARIIGGGYTGTGKKRYLITYKGKRLKSSINPKTLLIWFTSTYPNKVLQLTNNEVCTI